MMNKSKNKTITFPYQLSSPAIDPAPTKWNEQYPIPEGFSYQFNFDIQPPKKYKSKYIEIVPCAKSTDNVQIMAVGKKKKV